MDITRKQETRIMGKKKKSNDGASTKNVDATKSEEHVDETLEASNDETIEANDETLEAGEDGDANDDKPEDKPAKVKTWLGAQVERMRRAVQHNNLTAQVVRANHEIAKLSIEDANKIAKQIEKHTLAAKLLIEDFLGKIPEKHEGITPSKTGERQAPRNLLAGVKVSIKPEAVKSYAALFSVEELSDLTVVAAAGKMVRLQTPTKATLTIEAKNIIPAPVVAAA